MRALALVAAIAATLGTPAVGQAGAARPLTLGLEDAIFSSPDPALRGLWLNRAVDARAGIVVLIAGWDKIAPADPPPGFDAANPADPAYNWATLDASVRDAVAHGLRPIVLVNQAPVWAEGADRPADFAVAPLGTWKPRPDELGEFARALAIRYSGRFVDPSAPLAGPLPAVHLWEVWAEPNLSLTMTPQWSRAGPFSPLQYHRMLNAFYAAVHGVDPLDRVVTAGLAPYGDPRGGFRTPPVRFWRELLCLRGSSLRKAGCPGPVHFDIAGHNPIDVGPPKLSAASPLDVSTPDVWRLERIVEEGVRSGRVLPRRPKPFWATEIWWDSNPPDPGGVPERRQARWLAQSLYVLWRQRVRTVIWFEIRDSPPVPSFAATPQTGLFELDGRPKLAYRAFRFPFVVDRRPGGTFVWGKAPAPGAVIVERRSKGGWRQLARAFATSNRVFATGLALKGRALLRAKQGNQSSLSWRLG
ncbi:MAG TPA: hypothetical protein VNY83_07000 [Solirubrobacterales bacterium]|jgi:hypothetical protein|nr:hypothetical protein [Solirubrobacterales bacterium]